ncbi:hypothetical protein C8Q74DRAFT_1221540 [Fomes fomentarius]|nr:hypothetical protein C8Q74DRAFT_1221540 [Fomes fomentarius]
MKSFTALAVLAVVASAPILVLAGDYDATVYQGLGCRGDIDDHADGNNQGTGCRQAGEGASILIESLEGECQLFTYSEPGCSMIKRATGNSGSDWELRGKSWTAGRLTVHLEPWRWYGWAKFTYQAQSAALMNTRMMP